MPPFFKDEEFNYLTESALGAAYHQAADVGEVLSTVERIRNGDARSWAGEWTDTGQNAALVRQRLPFRPDWESVITPAGKALVRFTEAEGADSHCEPAGNGIRGERIFDWLDEQIPA